MCLIHVFCLRFASSENQIQLQTVVSKVFVIPRSDFHHRIMFDFNAGASESLMFTRTVLCAHTYWILECSHVSYMQKSSKSLQSFIKRSYVRAATFAPSPQRLVTHLCCYLFANELSDLTTFFSITQLFWNIMPASNKSINFCCKTSHYICRVCIIFHQF